MSNFSKQKGFTLIELLVVIAILAVLSIAVVLVLNPAELIRQGRDATRMSDLSAINSAIALFTADQPGGSGWIGATTTCTNGTSIPAAAATTTCTTNALTTITGTGWINIRFSDISSGSPLPKLPMDPVNSAASTACVGTPDGCFYGYKASSTFGIYKIYANMESNKYKTGATADVESNTKDGGTSDTWYEIGSNMSL